MIGRYRVAMAAMAASLLVASVGLSACGPVQSAGAIAAAAPETVSQVRAHYERARFFAEFLLPFLPADHHDRVVAIGQKVERFLSLAEVATTAAAQAAALRKAEAAIAELDAAPA